MRIFNVCQMYRVIYGVESTHSSFRMLSVLYQEDEPRNRGVYAIGGDYISQAITLLVSSLQPLGPLPYLFCTLNVRYCFHGTMFVVCDNPMRKPRHSPLVGRSRNNPKLG